MDLGTALLIIAFAYGSGVLWYDLIPGKVSMHPWRVAAYPFVAIMIVEGLVTLAPDLGGPRVGALHVFPAFVGALVAVIVDWIITGLRHPTSVETPEPLARPA